MKSQYIVDGYNLIHRIDALRSQMGKSLEAAREMLIRKLLQFQLQHRSVVTVVFDSSEGGALPGVHRSGINIIYTKPPQNADQTIKSIVDKNKNRHELVVVSSDQEVMYYAKASGCRFLSVESFYQSLSVKSETAANGAPEEKSNPQMSKKEIAAWLDLFKQHDEE